AVQILAQLLERFSYQAMLDEIRRSVRSELDRELGANPQKFTAAAAPASVPVPAAEEPEESMDDDVKAVESLFGDLFGGSDDEEEALDSFDLPEYEEGGSYSGSSDDSDEDEDDDSALPFDIMALLSEQAERMKDISPIDMMEAYDETVIDISLDDLGQYIRKMLRG
ncbi:MAG: hypothetical protein Q4B50_05580, partial [Bacillota bacterium]|nr:hypothetical protein [Bacillota bacterium]